MATLDFKTANDVIVGKIEYSYLRSKTQYTINYSVYFRRTNTYSGEATNGTIKYKVYIDNDIKEEESKKFTITNDKAWCLLTSGSTAFDLSALEKAGFKIGFESERGNTSSPPSSFKVEKIMSEENYIQAYATNAGQSSLNINFTKGNNYYSFSGVIGNNGSTLGSDNNNVTGCRVYYTTNNTEPTLQSPSFTINGVQKTSWERKIDISNDQTIRAIAYTLAPYGDIQGEEKRQEIYYYSPPSAPQGLEITFNKSKPIPKATYTFSWQKSTDGYNNKVDKYRVEIQSNNKIISIETDNNFVQYLGEKLLLKKGQTLSFQVYAQGDSDYNNISEISKASIEIVSAGIVKLKLNGTWVEGQVWIKKDGIWKEANEVYIKSQGKWNSSI